MHVLPIGVDSETKRGKPITFQFYSESLGIEKIIWLDNEKNATREFFSFLDSLPNTRDRHYVLFGHNLAFDMVSFFYDRHDILRDESIQQTWYGWSVEIVYAHVRFAVFRKKDKKVTLIDTLAYFVRKLEFLAQIVCPDLPKLKMPKGLGQKKFTPKDKAFSAYAMRDAVIAYRVGEKLLEMHREMDVSLAVSAPHFASKVFRKTFLKETIPLPPRKVIYAALNSYHGGKNNITVDAGYYPGVYCLDIRSAYPYAMRGFPSFSNAKLYRALSGTRTPKTGEYFPPFGIYKISGIANECKWPIIYDHKFKPVTGSFENIWITGFELNEALRLKEVKLTYVYGYYYDAEKDTVASPFAAYVDEFFKRKDTAKDKIYREFWKLLLNSLYGKFIQTRGVSSITNLVYDMDEKKLIEDSSIVASGLFNPFIASLITGHTRAYLHRIEHENKALHSSTDGIITQRKPKEIPGLGGLSIEAEGDALILRNKLYVIYAPRKRGSKKLKSKVYRGKEIIKYALHGFHGDVNTLEVMWKRGIREYEYTKVNKLRESLRRKLQVNDFVKNTATLTLKGE